MMEVKLSKNAVVCDSKKQEFLFRGLHKEQLCQQQAP